MEFKNVKHYRDAFELIRDYVNEDDISPEMWEAIEHVDDWEGYEYFVINYDTVVITQDWDDVIETCTVAEFVKSTLAYIQADND